MQSQYLPCDKDGRVYLYADSTHPINVEFCELIQDRVMAEYEAESIRAKSLGYASRYEEFRDE